MGWKRGGKLKILYGCEGGVRDFGRSGCVGRGCWRAENGELVWGAGLRKVAITLFDDRFQCGERFGERLGAEGAVVRWRICAVLVGGGVVTWGDLSKG